MPGHENTPHPGLCYWSAITQVWWKYQQGNERCHEGTHPWASMDGTGAAPKKPVDDSEVASWT